MRGQNTEIETKFYVTDLVEIERRVNDLGAKLIQPRTHETNFRFDTPAGDLTRSVKVLRLRKDTANRMTYKGPGVLMDGVRLRQEIEFEVSDFDNAKALLEALGYQVSLIYEKYRAVYDLDGVDITLDEMPFGYFVELEGPDAASVHAMCHKLEFDWEDRINESYAQLFNIVCQNSEANIPNLTFKDFDGIEISPEMLGIRVAE